MTYQLFLYIFLRRQMNCLINSRKKTKNRVFKTNKTRTHYLIYFYTKCHIKYRSFNIEFFKITNINKFQLFVIYC